MNVLRQSFLLIVVWLTTMVGCSRSDLQGKPFALPSGRVVRVISIAPVHYSNGNPPSLMLEYQTDLRIPTREEDSWKDLIFEVEDIWSMLRVETEKGNFTSAIVSAREVPHGFILKKANGYRFVYRKERDGRWRRQLTL